MNGVTRSSWQYAILLVILLATAALAVKSTILNLENDILENNLKHALSFTRIAIWALTLGFMSMAGAFGLWAIRFGTIAETRQRVGRIVEAMDSISDALIAIDQRGRVISANPALQTITGRPVDDLETMGSLFPHLSGEQLEKLLDKTTPQEIEVEVVSNEILKTFRFRSQPATGLSLIFVSDVTLIHDQQLRNRQAAQLQLVGQIARGVAHDFNNLLCGISGHASLLSHMNSTADDSTRDSLNSIARSADRGISLAGHLMSLGAIDTKAAPALRTADHIFSATRMLESDLSHEWRVVTEIQENLPPTPLSGIQWEQAIYHLGFAIADVFSKPGQLTITVRRPEVTDPRFTLPDHIAVAAVISGNGDSESDELLIGAGDEEGVIQSVVETVVSGVGGSLENISPAGDIPSYRIAIPHGSLLDIADSQSLPDELAAYMSNWQVAVATASFNHTELSQLLSKIGLRYEIIDSIIGALARIEADSPLDVIVVERDLLGDEADPLLKAILKLCPDTGIVVLVPPGTPEDSYKFGNQMIYEASDASAEAICNAMIRAKTLTSRLRTAS